MIRDITIGQYYPAKSVIHRLDPRVKVLCTIIFVVSLFIGRGILLYLVASLFLCGIVKISKVPVKFILKGLKPIFILLLFSVVVNMFFTPGGEVLVKFGIFQLTTEGIKTACYMAVRLIYLIIGSSLMTFTTTPTELTDGLERLCRGLNKIHVPVHEVAMMMSIALRFIPILTEELDKIMKAQAARCAEFDTGGLMKKIKGLIPILVPLFISAIRRANDLALAMEARCYRGGEGRTKMKPLVYKKHDVHAYIVIALYMAVMVTLTIIF